jgi:lysozyme family protein
LRERPCDLKPYNNFVNGLIGKNMDHGRHLVDNKFTSVMKFILHWEGGYVNHEKDPGGETRYGISKRAHPELDIKNLTVEKALEIYYEDYWKKAGCNLLDMPMAACVMNCAVMSGPRRAIGILEDVKDWKEYLENYRVFLFNLNRPDFIKGWTRRINDLRAFCIIWEQDHPESVIKR